MLGVAEEVGVVLGLLKRLGSVGTTEEAEEC